MSETRSAAARESAIARPARWGAGAPALGLAASVLAVGLACRELLRFAPKTHLTVSFTGSVEEFFFEPSDSSPLVVMALCGWLLWRRRRRLAPLWGLRGHPAATAGLWAAAVGLYTWSVRSGAPELQALALIPALLGAGHLLGGPAALRVMALPALVLLFAVPIPAPLLNEILWALQIWTADLTGTLVRWMGFSAFVSGDQIIMSDGLFQIIETCSGLRAIETLAMLAILMVDLFERRGWHAAALIAVSPAVAFLINGLRCVGLIFNPHADVASIHSLQGIVMLLGGVLLLYFFDGWLARIPRREQRLSAAERRARSAGGGARDGLGPRVALLLGFSLGLLSLSWLPPLDAERGGLRRVVELVPTEIGGWSGERRDIDWLFLGRAGFREPLHRRYTRDGERVDVFLGQARPSYRHRSYLSPKVGYPSGGWRVEHEERGRLADREVTLRVLRKGASRILVAHWFEASPGLLGETARALLAVDGFGPPREPLPVAVRLSTPVAGGRTAVSRARLEAFARELSPTLERLVAPRERA